MDLFRFMDQVAYGLIEGFDGSGNGISLAILLEGEIRAGFTI